MAQSQRILTTLEPPLFSRVAHMAARDGVSLSMKVRDLVREAVERDEDADLFALVEERRKKGGRFHSQAEMRKRYHW
jgi:hypothetical protein